MQYYERVIGVDTRKHDNLIQKKHISLSNKVP